MVKSETFLLLFKRNKQMLLLYFLQFSYVSNFTKGSNLSMKTLDTVKLFPLV